MRSLGHIRARVERLASTWPTSQPETVFVHWIQRFERCPACAYDLDAHARAAALAEAVEGHAPGEYPPTLVFYGTDGLTTCPRCGAPLPSDAPVR